ncbi:MAG: hypothetical protein HUJ42_02915 [Malacoplasma sp.]|nr:hypothetical protein [Malacoplasma sp.]
MKKVHKNYFKWIGLTSISSLCALSVFGFSENYEEKHFVLKDQKLQSNNQTTNTKLSDAQRLDLMKYYFRNNTYNMGYNFLGSCTTIAFSMILTYYDTFLNDDLIPEQFDVPAYTTSDDNFFPYSPGSYNDEQILKGKFSNVYEYLAALKQLESFDLQAKIISIADHFNYLKLNNLGPALQSYQAIKSIRLFLENYAKTNYQLNFTEIWPSSGDWQKPIRDYIDKGIPVWVAVRKDNFAHAVVAYDYDKDGNVIFNFGYAGQDAARKLDGFQIYEAYAVDLKADYKMSDNFQKVTINKDGAITAASVVTPQEIYDSLKNTTKPKADKITYNISRNDTYNGSSYTYDDAINDFKFKASDVNQNNFLEFKYDANKYEAKVSKDDVEQTLNSSFKTSTSGTLWFHTSLQNTGLWKVKLVDKTNSNNFSTYSFYFAKDGPQFVFKQDLLPIKIDCSDKDVKKFQYSYERNGYFYDFDPSWLFVKPGIITVKAIGTSGIQDVKEYTLTNNSAFEFQFDDTSNIFLKPYMNQAFSIVNKNNNTNAKLSVKKDGVEICKDNKKATINANGKYEINLSDAGKTFKYNFEFKKEDLKGYETSISENASIKSGKIVANNDLTISVKKDNTNDFIVGSKSVDNNKIQYNFFQSGKYVVTVADKFNNTKQLSFTVKPYSYEDEYEDEDTQPVINNTNSSNSGQNNFDSNTDYTTDLMYYSQRFFPVARDNIDLNLDNVNINNVENYMMDYPTYSNVLTIQCTLKEVSVNKSDNSVTLKYEFKKGNSVYVQIYLVSDFSKTEVQEINTIINPVANQDFNHQVQQETNNSKPVETNKDNSPKPVETKTETKPNTDANKDQNKTDISNTDTANAQENNNVKTKADTLDTLIQNDFKIQPIAKADSQANESVNSITKDNLNLFFNFTSDSNSQIKFTISDVKQDDKGNIVITVDFSLSNDPTVTKMQQYQFAASSFSNQNNNADNNNNNSLAIGIGVGVGVSAFVIIVAAVSFLIYKKRKMQFSKHN